MFDKRSKILNFMFKMFPFNVNGDAKINPESSLLISCILPTRNRTYELDRLLNSLSMQDIEKRVFEVIVLEDGCNKTTEEIVRKYSSIMNLKLNSNKEPLNSIGMLRNQGIELSTGKYILFLDDDTLLWQEHFLSTLNKRFSTMPDVDCIVIDGKADRCLIKNQYSYLDGYSFACRCVAYRRRILIKLGGFFNEMISYEDIELSIRFTALGGNVHRETELFYYHPPLYFTSWRKPISSGVSFLKMIKKYSLPTWLLCYINAIRFLPYLFLPSLRFRQWGKISGGFLIAPLFILVRGKGEKNLYE